VVGLSGAVMPGPLLALTVSEAIRYGFWAGPSLILGHVLLELSLVIALVLGLSQFIGNDLVLSIIGILGGAALLFMGLSMVRRGWHKASVPVVDSVNKVKSRRMVVSGVLVSASNPYWFIWWATVGMTYLLWSIKLGISGVACFIGGHILADLGWYVLVAFIVARGKRAIGERTYRWLFLVCGLALIALGGYFIASGIRFLTG
jgi:threonine/homoserine/homoserine lactone efflux protein